MSRRFYWHGEELKLRGAEMRVGDDIQFLSQRYRINRFEDYDPTRIGLPAEEGWRIAYAYPDADGYEWGITVSPRGAYGVIPQPGEAIPPKRDVS